MSKPNRAERRSAREVKRYETFLHSAIAETLAMSDEDILDGDPPGKWKAKGDAIVAKVKAEIACQANKTPEPLPNTPTSKETQEK